MHVGLHGFAIGRRHMEAAAQERRQLGTIAALGLLHRGVEPLQQLADLQGDIGVERHIDCHRGESEDREAVVAEELESGDRLRHFDKLVAIDDQRRNRTERARRKADRAAGHILDRFMYALVDIVGRRKITAARHDGRHAGHESECGCHQASALLKRPFSQARHLRCSVVLHISRAPAMPRSLRVTMRTRSAALMRTDVIAVVLLARWK